MSTRTRVMGLPPCQTGVSGPAHGVRGLSRRTGLLGGLPLGGLILGVLLCLLAADASARGFESVSRVESATAGSRLVLTDFHVGPPPPEGCLAALPDWAAMGIRGEEAGRTLHYYETSFEWIRETGFDGVILHLEGGAVPPLLRTALERTGLRATALLDDPFQTVAAEGEPYVWSRNAALKLAVDAAGLLSALPPERLVRDEQGRAFLFVAGSGRELDALPEALQDLFFIEVVERVEERLGGAVRLYWTTPTGGAVVRAASRFGEIRTVNANLHEVRYPMSDALGLSLFFLDSPCAGPAESRRARYAVEPLREALWLAQQAQCRMVRINGWNTLADGANICPDRTWGDVKVQVARAFVEAIREVTRHDYPPSLLVARRQPRTTLPDQERLGVLGRRYPFADLALAGPEGVEVDGAYHGVVVDDPAARLGDVGDASVTVLFAEVAAEVSPLDASFGLFQPLRTAGGMEETAARTASGPMAEFPLPFQLLTDAPAAGFAEIPAGLEGVVLANPRNQSLKVEVPAGRTIRLGERAGIRRLERTEQTQAIEVPAFSVLLLHAH